MMTLPLPCWRIAALAVLALFFVPGLVAQQPVAVGGKFQVNSYTTSHQRRPAVGIERRRHLLLQHPGPALPGAHLL